jgi:hypothetical protein
MTERWKKRPENSTWGDFGADDQLGRANLLTPEKVLQGVAEVKEGIAFCLSIPLGLPGSNKLTPVRYPPTLEPTLTPDGKIRFNYPRQLDDPQHTDVVCDDKVSLYCQYSTQWDSLAHVGSMFDADDDGSPEIRFYNGWQGGVDVVGPVEYDADGNAHDVGPHLGAQRLGVDKMAEKGMQGRGVMLDLYRHIGRDHTFVGYDAFMRAMEANGVEVEPGDMLCLYTGFGDVILEMEGDPDEHTLHHSCAVLDGRDEKLQQWVIDSGVTALISDNFAVEGLPSKPGDGDRFPGLPLHDLCLFRLGVNLGELWHLSELAAWLGEHGRTRFLLTAPPLRLPGAVGSPATPIATV